MVRKAYIFFIVLLIPFLNFAQGPREKSALKNINKQRWSKAYASLNKALSKDQANAPAYYLLSRYYFSPGNPAAVVDSAYKYVEKAIGLWTSGHERDRTRWSKLPLDSAHLYGLRAAIDSAAFEQVRAIDTEEAYSRFILTHPSAKQKQTAIDRRYHVAFEKAVEQNTFQAFESFLKNYPDAPQRAEATEKHDELLFLYSTRDQKVESFESFLKENPDSRYAAAAEKSIFDLSTGPGRAEDFLNFLKRHPQSKFRKKAISYLYHILIEHNEPLPPEYISDSLAAVISSQKNYLVPILVKGKFGFMDAAGKVVVPPTFDEIEDEYICGDIAEDAIVVPGKMLDQRGSTLLTGAISGIEDLGYGFMLVTVDGKKVLYHKGGFRSGDFEPEAARVLNGRILAIRNGGKWAAVTFGAKRLLPFEYDDMYAVGNVMVMKQMKEFQLATIDTVVSVLQRGEPFVIKGFDEIKPVNGNILVRKDHQTGLYNEKLKPIIPLAQQEITPTFFGAVVQQGDSSMTYNNFGEPSERFGKIIAIEPWIAAQTRQGWVLYNAEQRIYKSVPYDTVTLLGPFAIGKKKDGFEINLFKTARIVSLNAADSFEFLLGKDSVSYLLVKVANKSTVYDAKGQVLFTAVYDQIETAGNGYFIATRKDKKGLIDSSGKIVVPIQFDAFGSSTGDLISVLKSKKFGAFDIRRKELIPPMYEKNILRFDKNALIAYKQSGYGFIDSKNKPLSDFVFTEIQPWGDSTALVRQNGLYNLYNVYKKTSKLDGMRSVNFIENSEAERLAVVNKGADFGVVSNKRGVVIPVNFSDVVNVGSVERPLYLTEKHVQEASLFVVIYYDSNGKMLRREVYEQDEYERIYCDQK